VFRPESAPRLLELFPDGGRRRPNAVGAGGRGVRIREGRSPDIEACVRILRDSPEYFTEQGVRQAERYPGGRSTLVAVDRARVVGFATAVRKSAEVADIVALAVAPAWWRRRAGGRLVERCAHRLRRDGTVLPEAKTLAEESG
jgi:GNAT superfamily N-acetyltransferase